MDFRRALSDTDAFTSPRSRPIRHDRCQLVPRAERGKLNFANVKMRKTLKIETDSAEATSYRSIVPIDRHASAQYHQCGTGQGQKLGSMLIQKAPAVSNRGLHGTGARLLSSQHEPMIIAAL